MVHLKKCLALLSVCSFMTHHAMAETYDVSKTSPTVATVNLDTDGAFAISIPSTLWTSTAGNITKRYGTLYERRINPDGSETASSFSVTPSSIKNYTGRLSGTTEFIQIQTCYEYSNQPSNFSCSFSPVYLSVQSFTNRNALSTTNVLAPVAGVDLLGGNP